MDGKRVLITGASRGIGRAVAERVLSAGGVVGVNYLTSADAAAEVVGRYPGRAIPLQADVRDPEAVTGMVSRFVQEAGGIDVVINNAGFGDNTFLLRKALPNLRRELETNLLGPILVTQATLPQMLRQKGGLVAFVTSVSVQHPRAGQTLYSTTKAGVETFAQNFAKEYRSRGIRAICLRLGPVRTDMLAMVGDEAIAQMGGTMAIGRVMTPDEIAPLIAYLVSDAAVLANGCVVTLDSGFSLG
jgi:3-oxoacyl-[acyl-carrier protein] reductase